MVVISSESFHEICEFCTSFRGLTIHCEQDLRKKFSEIDPQVLSAILSTFVKKHIKQRHHRIARSGPDLLKE